MRYTKEKELLIIKLHSEGKNPTEIARELGTYNTTIRRVLLRNNIKLKNQSEAQASVINNPFKDYETNEKASYWLGYLIADGSVSAGKGGFRIILNTNKDPEHLQKYADYINRPLRKYWNKTYKVWEYSVVFCNKKIAYWLYDLGITPNKSLTFEFKGEFNNHLIRGVFDGDGYMDKDFLGITSGSIKFSEQLFNIFKNNNLSPSIYIDKRGNKCYNIVAKNRAKAERWIMKNATIFMERKHGQLISNN